MSEITSKKKLSQNPPRRDIEQKEKEILIAKIQSQAQKIRELQAQQARLQAEWVSKEITSREYTDKEMHEIYHLIKQGKKKEAWKILLKGHKCPATCYCQKPAKTWQEKIQKGNRLIELAEKKINEAEKLRVRKGTELLMKHFNSNK